MYKEKGINFEILKKVLDQFLEKSIFLIFIAHGIAHLVGFFIYWKLMAGTTDTPYSTKIFFSQIDIGIVGVSLLGFIYLVLAVLFVSFGILLIIKKIPFNDVKILVLILFSLVITIINLMPTIIGLIVNIVYLSVYLMNKKLNLI